MSDYLEQKIDYYQPEIVLALDELSLWSARFGIFLLEQLEIIRGLKVLDVGCGTGFPLLELAQLSGSSCQFTGLDIWKAGLERAEFKSKIYGLKNVSFVQSQENHFPLPSDEFDLIVSNLGINNFADPDFILAECARVAKPNARLVLTTNLTGHFQEFYQVYRQVLHELNLSKFYLERLEADEQHRSNKALVLQRLNQAGFSPAKVVEREFQIHFSDGSALLRHWLTRLGFLEAWRKIVSPPDEQAVFARLEEALNEIAHREGNLKMTVPMLYVESIKPN